MFSLGPSEDRLPVPIIGSSGPTQKSLPRFPSVISPKSSPQDHLPRIVSPGPSPQNRLPSIVSSVPCLQDRLHSKSSPPVPLSGVLLFGGPMQQPDPAVTASRRQCLPIAVHGGERLLRNTCGEYLQEDRISISSELHPNAYILVEMREVFYLS